MKRTIMLQTLVCLLLGVGSWPAAAQDGQKSPTAEDMFRATAEIRIDLPPDTEPRVSVAPGNRRVVIDVPRGAVYPLDFAASSGGMLRAGRVVNLDENRVRLELDLAQGLVDRIDFEPTAIILRFVSRFEIQSESSEPEDQYTLGADDELVLTVHGHPDYGAELTINREGYISAPLIGDVKAEGLSPRGLVARLTEMFGQYLVSPHVDISVAEYRSQWVMVAGEVRLPGRISLRGGTRLKEVLSEAGGFDTAAGEELMISRTPEGVEGEVTIIIERDRFENGETNPTLQSGDIITVARAAYCYVNGEVQSPTRVRVERGTTLLQALAVAGGLTDWANRKEVRVLSSAGTKPKTYNVKKILEGKGPDPLLVGGEIIHVPRRFF